MQETDSLITKNKQDNNMTAKLAETYALNRKLEAGTISFESYHLALLKINQEDK